MLALEIKGIEYHSQRFEVSKNEHRTSEFLALNPRGKVPVMQFQTFVIRESLAILTYLDRLGDSQYLFGSDAISTAQTWQWIMDYNNFLGRDLETIVPMLFRDTVNAHFEEFLEASASVKNELTTLDTHLHDHHYLVGSALSAADIILYPRLQWLKRALVKSLETTAIADLAHALGNCHHLQQWERVIESIPGFEDTYPPHWKTT